ncbi:LPS export ABC transporter periplasmic protein LptC [Pseudoduganella sp. UC29_106]|uniref:LPS export ABC transporter periplasmic protein LptC n=1 Tax=Pseudoduganella sp. UC29_106 TaxID=3374553 RepID=UPI003757E765
MRNQRTAHRFRLSLGMLLALFAAVGSFWILELLNRAGEEMQADMRMNEPDYIVERFSFVRLNKVGKPSYIISGDKLTHRPIDDSSEIDKPIVRSLAEDKPPMDIRSKTARVDDVNSRVTLRDEVRIDRAAGQANQELHLETDKLVIYPDEDRMETDQPVRMKSGETTAQASGMRANNASRQLELSGRGTLVFPPKAR